MPVIERGHRAAPAGAVVMAGGVVSLCLSTMRVVWPSRLLFAAAGRPGYAQVLLAVSAVLWASLRRARNIAIRCMEE
jgi:hypothetical protein